MKTEVKTPYGTFATIADCINHIYNTHAIEFVEAYQYDVTYNQATHGHHFQHTNNALKHYIDYAVHKLLGSATSGKRSPAKGWGRV